MAASSFLSFKTKDISNWYESEKLRRKRLGSNIQSRLVQCTTLSDGKRYFNKLWGGKMVKLLFKSDRTCLWSFVMFPVFSPWKEQLTFAVAIWDLCSTSSLRSLCCSLILLCLNLNILPWQYHSRDILHSHWRSALPPASLCPWWQHPSLNCNLFVVRLSLLFVISHAFYPWR